jgi:hypothetical protein
VKLNEIYVSSGIISSVRILEKNKFSNKGNALDGMIELENGLFYGLNIGGNPIGTGNENYLSFLEDLKCEKFLFGLYDVNSFVGKDVSVLFRVSNSCGVFSYNYILINKINYIFLLSLIYFTM